jgi:hypothetical protein
VSVDLLLDAFDMERALGKNTKGLCGAFELPFVVDVVVVVVVAVAVAMVVGVFVFLPTTWVRAHRHDGRAV